jgi:hypothetical protein
MPLRRFGPAAQPLLDHLLVDDRPLVGGYHHHNDELL